VGETNNVVKRHGTQTQIFSGGSIVWYFPHPKQNFLAVGICLMRH
jgi:hypothetical protein